MQPASLDRCGTQHTGTIYRLALVHVRTFGMRMSPPYLSSIEHEQVIFLTGTKEKEVLGKTFFAGQKM